MSKSNPNNTALFGITILLLLVLLVLAFAATSAHKIPHAVSNYYETSQYAVSAKNRTEALCADLPPASASKCRIEIEQSERENHRSQKDLRAQHYMGIWTFFMALSAVATVGVSALGLIWIMRTFEQTRLAVESADKAVKVTRETGRDQSRAYVHANSARLYWGGDCAQDPKILVEVCNTGQTPARWFSLTSKVQILVLDGDGSVSEIGNVGDVDFSSFQSSRWNALGAGDSLTALSADTDGISRLTEEYSPPTIDDGIDPAAMPFAVQIIGYVEYETVFGEVFRSEFGFGVRQPRIYRSEAVGERFYKGANLNLTVNGEVPIKLLRTTHQAKTYQSQ